MVNPFISVLIVSKSENKTFNTIKANTNSKVQFPDEAGPSTRNSQQTQETNTSSATVTPSTPDLLNYAFSIALSKNFTQTLLASLTSKNAVLNEIHDCILTRNEERSKMISPYINSFWND